MKTYNYGKQFIDEEDIKIVVETLKSNYLTCGPKVKEFEQAICDYTGAKYCVVVNSATSGLHLAMMALNIKENDEVITSPMTFLASANCARYCNATVKFADIEKETANINPNEIQKQMNDALDKVRLNINEIALENPVAAIRFSGTGRFINQTAQLNGQLAITNFDLISPDYQTQCAAERAKQPQTDKQLAVVSEPVACTSVGVLDSLRPYLDSAEHASQNGKPVVLFKIEYKNGQAFVNDKPFTKSIPETTLEKDNDTQK